MCCASRPDYDHETSVENYVASLDRQVYHAKRGDILCCAPADMAVNAVCYFPSPGADNTVGKPTQRGDKLLMQGRRGGWAFNKNGFFPLWHPIKSQPSEANVLFAFDHHSTTFDDHDDDDSSDESVCSQGSAFIPTMETPEPSQSRLAQSPRRSEGKEYCKAHLMLHRRGR